MNSILVHSPILSLTVSVDVKHHVYLLTSKKVFWCRPSYRTWNSRMTYLFKLFNLLQVLVIGYGVVFLSHCGLMSTSSIPPTTRAKCGISVVGRTDGGIGRGPSHVRFLFLFSSSSSSFLLFSFSFFVCVPLYTFKCACSLLTLPRCDVPFYISLPNRNSFGSMSL